MFDFRKTSDKKTFPIYSFVGIKMKQEILVFSISGYSSSGPSRILDHNSIEYKFRDILLVEVVSVQYLPKVYHFAEYNGVLKDIEPY